MKLGVQQSVSASQQLINSQRFFNQVSLFFYDFLLYGFISKYAWGCAPSLLKRHYARFITANHLEVGVGTGYLLDKATFPVDHPRLVLMDFSQSCLNKTQKRLRRYQPTCYQQNILEPITEAISGFDSIGINYVMHCVPGSFKEKGIAFAHLKTLLNKGGVLFGSTVLYQGVSKNAFSQALMWFLNAIGVFLNKEDHLDDLRACLSKNFEHVEIEVQGSVAIFWVN